VIMKLNDEKVLYDKEWNGMAEELRGVTEERDKYLVCYIGDNTFAMPIAKVAEIIGFENIEGGAENADLKKGVVDFGGEKISFVSLGKVFYNEKLEYTDKTCFIVTRLKDGKIAFVVKAVAEVTDFNGALIMKPSLHARRHIDSFVVGVVVYKDEIIQILDVDKILK